MCSVWNYYVYPRGHGFTGLVPPTMTGEVTSDGGRVELKYDGLVDGGNRIVAAFACPGGG